MNFIDRAIASFAPQTALKRVRARHALELVNAHYDAASFGRRSKSWVANSADADGAAARRQRIAFIARDMVRNTPFAARAQQVIANNVVGPGIIPKITAPTKALKAQGLALVQSHLDTTAIDADGRTNFYGLQRLVMNAVVDSGEVLIRRRKRRMSDGLPLPLQIQVLEADYIDSAWDGRSADNGNEIIDGIEYDQTGKRVAYYLFDQHPGSANFRGFGLRTGSRRVPASEVLHIYRQDRPGQRRGVSWFASVALNLQDFGDYQDAQLMKQKVAACFAVFRTNLDSEDEADASSISSLQPGAVYDLAPGEDVKFASPPGADGFDEYTRVILRSIAAGLGVTYEALAGDFSNVNFSSGRMGRMEMDRNVESWQWLMMVPQFLIPFSKWFMDAWLQQAGNRRIADCSLSWNPPHRILVDPNKEINALRDKVRAGFASRQSVIRQLGDDPETVILELKADHDEAREMGLTFDSEAVAPAHAEPAQNGAIPDE